MTWMEVTDGGPHPKRGDIIETNIGGKRERTWLVLRATRMRDMKGGGFPRFKLFMARWWELEADMRMRLWRSATRNGGQSVFHFKRYSPRRTRRTFEQYMQR